MKAYVGSIAFYKHLLLGALALLVLGLITMVLVFGMKCAKMSESLALADDSMPAPITEKEQEYSIPYQKDYPGLYAEKPVPEDKNSEKGVGDAEKAQKKVIYLTFDDGPSSLTIKILDILDNYQIKATFFVIGREDEFSKSVYKEIVARGHTIGIHTYSHQYKQIYASVDAYLADFNKIYELIYNTTGVKPQIFRFPGGSINSYNAVIYQELIAEMLRRGFVYYDWNISSGDTAKRANKASVIENTLPNVKHFDQPILLFHDSADKSSVAAALPQIIESLQEKGYAFGKLDATVPPICFGYVK